MMLPDIVIALLVTCGAVLIMIAALGLLRMPDLYSRLHAASKAATLGTACLALALVIHFAQVEVSVRAAALGLILFVTAPLSAHLIARAGFVSGTQLEDRYVVDETTDWPSTPPARQRDAAT